MTIHELITVRTIYSLFCNASGIAKNKKTIIEKETVQNLKSLNSGKFL